MTREDICRVFRDITVEIAGNLRKMGSREDYYAVVGTGPSGDTSRLIDIYSEDLFAERIWSTGIKAWIIGEERGIRKNTDIPEYIVLLDPLDGSLNYIHGIEYASISMAVYRPGSPIYEPVYGVVKSIFTNLLIEICDGRVYLNENELTRYREGEDVIVSIYTEDPSDIVAVKEAYRLSGVDVKIRTMGSASLESALASIGYISGFIHLTGKLRNLDIAVSIAIAHKLNTRYIIEPTVDKLSTSNIQLVRKVAIARPTSPIWKSKIV